MLQSWSKGNYKATVHRVVLPTDVTLSRQSMAFFCHPNYDVVIDTENGEQESAFDHLTKRFNETIVVDTEKKPTLL